MKSIEDKTVRTQRRQVYHRSLQFANSSKTQIDRTFSHIRSSTDSTRFIGGGPLVPLSTGAPLSHLDVFPTVLSDPPIFQVIPVVLFCEGTFMQQTVLLLQMSRSCFSNPDDEANSE